MSQNTSSPGSNGGFNLSSWAIGQKSLIFFLM